jgi:excisionase family DNA binding protein
MSVESKQPVAPQPKQLFVSVDEAAILLGISAHSVRNHVRDGKLPSVRLGRRVLLPLRQLRRIGAGE